MAYCASCGAYIPDGQTKCLACGYDEAEQQQEQKEQQGQQTAASQSAGRQYTFEQEELHRKLEEQRRRQQESNRQWAEQERARRQRQEADRQWAKEEYERRQQERAQQEEADAVQRAVSEENAAAGTARRSGNRALAVLSYFSVLFTLPYFFAPQDEFTMYHARQGLRLFLFSLVVDIVGSLFSLGWLGSLVRIYLIIKGVSNASEGKKEPLPFIGTWDPRKK